jgi:lysophospholipase L1-like esterase
MSTFSILGDSISTFEGYIPKGYDCFFPRSGYSVVSVDQTWWRLFEKRSGFTLLLNDSYSGSRISKTGIEHPHSSAFVATERLSILPPSDFLIIFGGTNDWGQPMRQASLKCFRDSYALLIQLLLAKKEIHDLYFCTPLVRTDIPSIDKKNQKGWSERQLHDVIREETAKAKDGRVHLVDLASIPLAPGDLEDGLHPTVKGMELICGEMLKSFGV